MTMPSVSGRPQRPTRPAGAATCSPFRSRTGCTSVRAALSPTSRGRCRRPPPIWPRRRSRTGSVVLNSSRISRLRDQSSGLPHSSRPPRSFRLSCPLAARRISAAPSTYPGAPPFQQYRRIERRTTQRAGAIRQADQTYRAVILRCRARPASTASRLLPSWRGSRGPRWHAEGHADRGRNVGRFSNCMLVSGPGHRRIAAVVIFPHTRASLGGMAMGAGIRDDPVAYYIGLGPAEKASSRRLEPIQDRRAISAVERQDRPLLQESHQKREVFLEICQIVIVRLAAIGATTAARAGRARVKSLMGTAYRRVRNLTSAAAQVWGGRGWG